MRRVWIAAVLAMPAMAQAQDLSGYGDRVAACYRAAGDRAARAACIGRAAEACMEGEPGGETTMGMVECSRAAAAGWDALLNEEYAATRAWAAEMDAANRAEFPEFAHLEGALRDAQRAWIAFRDAECGLEYAVWGAGSMRNIAAASCQLDMTARRTLDLRALREGMP